MSLHRIEWGSILAMETDLRNIGRIGDVLSTVGCGSESLSADGCYVLGCMLRDMGTRLEAVFDGLGKGPNEGRCD